MLMLIRFPTCHPPTYIRRPAKENCQLWRRWWPISASRQCCTYLQLAHPFSIGGGFRPLFFLIIVTNMYTVLPSLIAQGPPLWLGVGNYLKLYNVVLLYIGNPLSLVVYESLHILATLSSLLPYHWLVYICVHTRA